MNYSTACYLSEHISIKNSVGTVVTAPGRYVTRKGEVVTVDRLGGYGNLWASGRYPDGTEERWFVSGRLHTYTECPNDIVAERCLNCDAPAPHDSDRCPDCQSIAYQERQDEEVAQ